MSEQVVFPEEQFPSQDPLEAAEIIATDDYQRNVRRPGELSDWLDGSQANAEEVAEYLKSRPSLDSAGRPRHPETSKMINGDKYFDKRRDAHTSARNRAYEDMDTEELTARITDADTHGDPYTRDEITEVMKDKFKDMSSAQLARELARADHREDDSIADLADESLRDKFDEEGEKLGKKTGDYSEEEHEIAEDNRWSRLMKLYDRELTRLETKGEIDPGVAAIEPVGDEDQSRGFSGWKSLKGRVKQAMSKAAEALLNGGVNRKIPSAVVAGSVIAAHEVELPTDEYEADQSDMTPEQTEVRVTPAEIPEEEREVSHA